MNQSSNGHTDSIRFHEEQQFKSPWLWLVVGTVAITQWLGFLQQVVRGKAWGNHPAPNWMMVILWLTFGIGLPFFFLYTKLSVTVTNRAVKIGFRPLTNRRIPLSDIVISEARTYSPLREYGGWGIRQTFGGKRAYNVSGNQGVELTLSDGRSVLIGSQEPEQLAHAIGSARSEIS